MFRHNCRCKAPKIPPYLTATGSLTAKNKRETVTADRSAVPPESSVPVIEIRDLHQSYGQLEVLKGVSLTAHEGDVIAIIGGSGSGKSTFLRCINMLELPSAGSVMSPPAST